MKRNSNNSGFSTAMVISLFLAFFLIAIILVAMLGVMKVTDYDAGVPAIIFAVINMLALAIVYGAGGVLSKKLGVGGYAPVAGMTAVYTVVQLVYMFVAYKSASPIMYTLISLIILFVYCAIILPIALNGAKNKNN